MKITKVVVAKKKAEQYAGELLVTFVARNAEGDLVGDSLLKPLLPSLHGFKEFSAKKEQYFQMYPSVSPIKGLPPCKRLLLLGLGDITAMSDPSEISELLRTAGGIIAGQCKRNMVATAGINIPELESLNEALVGEYVTEGILLGAYQFLKYQKKDDDVYPGLKKIEFFSHEHGNRSDIGKGIDKGVSGALAVCAARDMANEPGNCWTPWHFADSAKKIAKELKLKCTILEKSDMTRLAMGGILAVNKGSEEAPKMVILEYNRQKNVDTVLLVGKGLTFDSGGISLKPAQGMMDMKYDMCGGAAVLAAMEAIARERPEVNVVAIVPSTDNMAGGGAVKPGDVITHYGGITSEIENTDAEGRLILADAIAYGIEKYQPACVIDLATLTGAVIIALGHHYSGLLSNNDQLAARLVAAGKMCCEPLWRLPLGEMYAKQIKSKVADIKNTGGKPAGSITAAEYLHKFVGEVPWAHLDIAGTAWDFTEKSYMPGGPSGVGVRTLIELLRSWENGKLTNDKS
ncbi:leucyl aminopeptidase [Desulfocastanea catecholica]